MAGKRIYTARFHAVAISAVQDLFSLKAGAAAGIELHYCSITATGQAAAAEYDIEIKRVTGATVTQGSAGSTPAAVANDTADTKAAAATVHANDTTQATGTTVTSIESEYWNVLNKFEHFPAPEDRFSVQAGELIAVTLSTAPGAATTCSGTIKWAETP